MAFGGKWETQNKELNGAYVNIETDSLVVKGIDSRGKAAIPVHLDWGEPYEVTEVSPTTDFIGTFGKELKDIPELLHALKGNSKLYAFNLASKDGKKSKANHSADDGLTVTVEASKPGALGNKVTVAVEPAPGGQLIITEYLDGMQVKQANVEIKADATEEIVLQLTTVIIQAGSGASLAEAVALKLEGGVSGTVTGESWTEFLKAIDKLNVKAFSAAPEDESVKTIITAQVKTWRDDEGKMVVASLPDFAEADFEGVRSMLNGLYLKDGFVDKEMLVHFDAAAYANAGPDSLTYKTYPGAVGVEALSKDELIKAKREGHLTWVMDFGADGFDRVVLESDINTLTTFTPKKNQDFRKGKIVRAMDHMTINIQHIWARYFIGKVNNNEDGRKLFKGSVYSAVLAPMENLEMIEGASIDDIEVSQGEEKDAVVAVIGVKFIDAMEKLYVTVNCE